MLRGYLRAHHDWAFERDVGAVAHRESGHVGIVGVGELYGHEPETQTAGGIVKPRRLFGPLSRDRAMQTDALAGYRTRQPHGIVRTDQRRERSRLGTFGAHEISIGADQHQIAAAISIGRAGGDSAHPDLHSHERRKNRGSATSVTWT